MIKMQRLLGFGAALVLAVSAGLAGAAEKPTLNIGFVDGWSDSEATTHVAAEVIKQRLGYEVKLVPVATGIMWQGMAKGQLDAMLSAWLPTTHGAYYERFKDKVVNLGSNFTGAKIGLIVPDYVSATRIADLRESENDFDARIVGIDAGSGVMLKTAEAITAYDLDYKLQASSSTAMLAELERSIRAEEPIVVTGWIPHWMFTKWKLRFLEDPKGIYGAAEHVDTLVSPELSAKAPSVVAFLSKFNWTANEIGTVMLAIEEGATPAEAAQQWITANPQRVQEWLQ